MPIFADENGAITALQDAGVPILMQAYPDEIGKMDFAHRRDAYCGKFSVTDVFTQYNVPFTVMKPHVVHPLSEAFAQNLKDFAAICRVVNGMKRFNVVNEGYNIEEVNRFIDIVIIRLEKLNNENAMLQAKISSLEDKLKEEKVNEIKVTEARMAARETSDRIKSLAREEANMIVEAARNNANAIVHEALLNAEKTEHEAMLLKKNITVYKNRVKNIIKSQLEIADDLDKYDLDK